MTKKKIEALALEAYPIKNGNIYVKDRFVKADENEKQRLSYIQGFNKAFGLFNNISRFELINHVETSRFERGRIFVFKKDIDNAHKIDFDFQDYFKTLKVFIK